MIDYFAIGLTHGLLALAALRLVMRGDIDRDGPAPEARARPQKDASRRKGRGDA